MQANTAAYRSDIDGLRAVAVAAVIAFHAEINFIFGGYVGVDVFFVISGFLITRILLSDLEEHGSMQLGEFYRRRLGRILPALFVVFAATVALAGRYAYPDELVELARSLLSALFSVSNFYFRATAGYFDSAAETKPLLHTWSLGVEEQFYLVMPALLFLTARLARRRVAQAIGGLTVISFFFCVLATPLARDAAFYLLPFRAWELGLGATLAAVSLERPVLIRQGWLAALAGLLGLAAIIFAVLRYDETTPFPGYPALLPCAGAAAIIVAGATRNPVSSLLGCLPMRALGLVSYSLYLWHWPLIVFQRQNAMFFEDSHRLSSKIGVLAIALLIAILTYFLVERPFRRASRQMSARAVFAFGAGTTALLAAACIATITIGGFVNYFPAGALALKTGAPADFSHFRPGKCFIFEDASGRTTLDPTCLQAAADKRNVMLIGDSHAAHLWSGLQEANPDMHVEQATGSGCAPVWRKSLVALALCDEVVKVALDRALGEPSLEQIILTARWKNRDFEALAETLDRLKAAGRTVTVLGPIVEYSYPLPRILADAMRRHNDRWVLRNRSIETKPIDAALKTLVEAHGARYVSLVQLLCEGDACTTLDRNGNPIQFDYGHLTRAGSKLVAQRLRDTALLR